jgi:uncharacterized protein YqeY
VRLGTLRLLSAAAKNREVELRRRLTDEELLEVAGREAKRRREAIEVYERAGRADRAASEREELEVLETYLPAAMEGEEVDALVREAVTATGAKGIGDVGRVVGFVMARARGRVDGKAVQARVRSQLAEGETEVS